MFSLWKKLSAGSFAAPDAWGANAPRTWLWLPIALLLAALPLWRAFEMPGLNMDEGMLLVYPELILKGQLPYRDFETFYGPANLWVLAGFYQLFGVSIDVERGVGLIYRLVLLAGIFATTHRWGSWIAVLSTVAGSVLIFLSQLPAFAWFGGLACILWSLIALAGANGSIWRTALGGMLAGIALLYRVDLGPAVILSTLPLWLSLAKRHRWIYLAAFTASLLPLALLCLGVGWRALFENLFLYPVVIANPGRRLPLSEANREVIFLFCLHVGAVISALLAGILAVKDNWKDATARLYLSVAILAVGLTYQSLQRADALHVAFAACLSFALLPLSLHLLARRGRLCRIGPIGAISTAAAAVALLYCGSPSVVELHRTLSLSVFSTTVEPVIEVRVGVRRFPAGFPPPLLQGVLMYLDKNARAGERLFVGTGDLRRTFINDTFIYHLLPQLTPATYFLEMNPLSANRVGSRLAADVASADWLVLNQAWDESPEPNLSRQNGSNKPNEIVLEQFELRGQSGPFQVYGRKPDRTEIHIAAEAHGD